MLFSSTIASNDVLTLAKSNKFLKITKTEDIPELIIKKIHSMDKEGELKRGIWCFSHSTYFNTDVSYILICGGKTYGNGYDVDIINQNKSYIDQLGGFSDVTNRRRQMIYYIFEINEKSPDSSFEYCKGICSNFVLFKSEKLASVEGEHVEYAYNQHGNKIWSGGWSSTE